MQLVVYRLKLNNKQKIPFIYIYLLFLQLVFLFVFISFQTHVQVWLAFLTVWYVLIIMRLYPSKGSLRQSLYCHLHCLLNLFFSSNAISHGFLVCQSWLTEYFVFLLLPLPLLQHRYPQHHLTKISSPLNIAKY